MSHSKLRLLLNDYVDRALPGSQRAEVSAHLAECESCATEVRELEHAVGGADHIEVVLDVLSKSSIAENAWDAWAV